MLRYVLIELEGVLTPWVITPAGVITITPEGVMTRDGDLMTLGVPAIECALVILRFCDLEGDLLLLEEIPLSNLSLMESLCTVWKSVCWCIGSEH